MSGILYVAHRNFLHYRILACTSLVRVEVKQTGKVEKSTVNNNKKCCWLLAMSVLMNPSAKHWDPLMRTDSYIWISKIYFPLEVFPKEAGINEFLGLE